MNVSMVLSDLETRSKFSTYLVTCCSLNHACYTRINLAHMHTCTNAQHSLLYKYTKTLGIEIIVGQKKVLKQAGVLHDIKSQ